MAIEASKRRVHRKKCIGFCGLERESICNLAWPLICSSIVQAGRILLRGGFLNIHFNLG
jgi:hypothetical protein